MTEYSTRLHGCPHCVGIAGHCCVCQGTRRVLPEVAAHNVRWLWGWNRCGCDVCRALERQRRAIPLISGSPAHAGKP